MSARWMRLKGLIRKETYQLLRDPSSIAIAFVMPVILLFLFGYGVSLDANHIRVGVVVEVPTTRTASLVSAFADSPFFGVVPLRDMRQGEAMMMDQRIKAVISLRADFSRKLDAGAQAPIGVLVDGTDANTARLVEGYVEGVWNNWREQEALGRGEKLESPVELAPRVWFNPELRSRYFLLPGLVAIIMTLIGTLLTALVVAREWERGTMEALMTTPVTVGELVVGKLVPYFVLGMGGMALSVVMAVFVFGVPLRGSLWVLVGTSALFLMAALAMGLLISTLARNQFVAGQVAIIAAYLPAFMLSGFVFEISSMPLPIRIITHAVAARYFVAILQTLFLAGDVWSVILPNAAALVVFIAIFLAATARRTRKRLD